MEAKDKALDEMSMTEVKALVSNLETRNEELIGLVDDELQEAGEFGRAQLALEDIGWRPLAGICEGNSFTLDALHRISELCRAVASVNPLVERGLKVRTGYIWGSGVSVVPKEFIQGPGRPRTVNTVPTLPEGLEDVLTGTLAQMEIESSAATDGNLFFLVDRKNKTVQRVPFEEITAGISQRGNREKLMYIRRTWNDWDLDWSSRGVVERPFTDPQPEKNRGRAWLGPNGEVRGPGMDEQQFHMRSVWYPTPSAIHNRREARSTIMNEPTDHKMVMIHIPFNRLTGWRWGVPDVLPAIWWTKAYKEYLENCATLTKAYARFAWKVTNEKSKGVRRTAATLAQTPRTDPSTGQALSVGASAVLGAGQDLAAVGSQRAVDFDAGRPLVAMVAAALDVPLPALTEDPSIGNRSTAQSLDTSTILVMQARQRAMNEAFQKIFEMMGLKVRLRWPEISEEPIHRRLQAIDMAVRMGLLTAEEARAMVLDAWHDKWDDFPAKPPEAEDLPLVLRPGATNANTGTGVLTTSTPPLDTAGDRKAGPGTPNPLKAGNDHLGGRPSSGALRAPRQPDPISRGDSDLRNEDSP